MAVHSICCSSTTMTLGFVVYARFFFFTHTCGCPHYCRSDNNNNNNKRKALSCGIKSWTYSHCTIRQERGKEKKIKAYNNQHTKTCPQSGALQVKATDYEFNHVKNDRQTMSLNAHKISTRHTTDAFSVTFGGDRHFCVTPVRLLRRVTSTS